MFKRARKIIANSWSDWQQRARRAWLELQTGASGEMVTEDAQPWRIVDGTEGTAPFMPVPRSIREMGDKAVAQYVAATPSGQRLTEAYDRYKTQFGDDYLQGEPFSMLNITDPLTEWDYSERVSVLEQCHLAWERNPDANAAVTFNRLFAVGGGMQRMYRNMDVEAAIEAFCGNPDNAFEELERTLVDTLQVDGELFLRFHGVSRDKDASDIIMTPLPPWGVRRIKHETGFIRRVEAYEYVITEDNGMGQVETVNEDIPAADVVHVAINRKAYELRGRPELYKVLVWLQAHKEFLENRARQNWARGSLVYDVTLTNATAAQVSAKRAQYKKPPSGQAALVIHNDKEIWQVIDPKIGADDAKEDGRQFRLKVATGMRLPEYMLADGSMSNLATATAQALPAVKSFEDWQDVARDRVFKPMFLKVLERAGFDLDAEVPQHDPETGERLEGEIKVRDAFEIKYQALKAADPKNIMEALAIGVTQEWMSNETASGLMPFDLDVARERRKISAERQQEMDEIAQGLRMAPPMVNQPGQQSGGMNGEGQGQDREQDEDQAGVPEVR